MFLFLTYFLLKYFTTRTSLLLLSVCYIMSCLSILSVLFVMSCLLILSVLFLTSCLSILSVHFVTFCLLILSVLYVTSCLSIVSVHFVTSRLLILSVLALQTLKRHLLPLALRKSVNSGVRTCPQWWFTYWIHSVAPALAGQLSPLTWDLCNVSLKLLHYPKT